jgi:flagellin
VVGVFTEDTMSRINTNVSSLLAQRVLGNQNRGLVSSLERLSTGLRINRGADNPAGLIASESLRSEKASIAAAISNAQRAEQVVNVAEGGLQEINNLLLELQSLIGESANEAGVSPEEKEANQLQIDSILQTIDRVANSTSFNGMKLLNGNFDYTTADVENDKITDVRINAAKLSDSGGPMSITVQVQQSARTAAVYLSTLATLENDNNGSITIEVTGSVGSQQFTFASGTSQANIISAINTFSEALGVTASTVAGNGDRIQILSNQFGSAEFVRVKILNGTTDELVFDAATAGNSATDMKLHGRDATVLINGQEATTNGLTARVATDGFDVAITISGFGELNDDGESSSFDITGGGATFNLSPKVSLAGKAVIGIQSVSTGNLGDRIDGLLSDLKSGGVGNVVNGDLTKAQNIVDLAIKQVAGMRGRLGAFQKNTVTATINNLGVALENTAAAESTIRDTDFAAETATLTRQQIMAQAATQALAIANAQPQAVLALLG